MSPLAAWSIVCGAALGLGAWSLVGVLPRLGRPRLLDRVAPYVTDVSEAARQHINQRTVSPLPVIGALLSPALYRLRSVLAALVGGGERIEQQLRQSGAQIDIDHYRWQQLLCTIAGFVAGLVVAVASIPVGAVPPAVQLLLPPVAAALGLLARDWVLARAAAARVGQISGELPTVLEFLTLSLAAGEGILDSLRRVAEISRGQLSREFATVVGDVNTGVPLAEALHHVAHRVRLPALTRCVEQLTGALERGAPLAEVLRAQAQDARDLDKRVLLEAAGKKEVAMLFPLVFMILPLTIGFAIFPGIVVLQAGF